jgi:thiol-disulfide isomerase/thioredoxin
MRARAILAAAALLCGACRSAASAPAEPNAAQPSATAAMTVVDGAGAVVPFDAVRKRVTVVSLWATYCAACTSKLGVLEALARRYAEDRDVAILAVNLDVPETVEGARDVIARRAPSVPSYYAPALETIAPILPRNARGELTPAVPATVVIDEAGRMHAVAPAGESGGDVEREYARLVELARRGELPPRAHPVRDDPVALQVQTVGGALHIAVLQGARRPDVTVDAIVLLAEGFGVADARSSRMRTRIEEQLAAGETTIVLPLAVSRP